MSTSLSQLLRKPACGKFLLVLDAIIWAVSTLVTKDLFAAVEVGWLLAIRYILAALLMFALFHKQILIHLDRRTIKIGIMLGLYGWGGFLLQNMGLMYTTPGKNVFLTALYVVIVPFVAWIWKMGAPERYNIAGAVLSLIGLGFVALDKGLDLNMGDILTIGGAIFFALQICEVSKYGQDLNTESATFWEFVVMGGLSLIYAVLTKEKIDITTWDFKIYAELVFLIVVCSCFTLVTTNIAFSVVDATSGSILASLEAPIGVALSVLLGFELLNGRILFGFGLIMIGILLSEAGPQIIKALSWGNKHRD